MGIRGEIFSTRSTSKSDKRTYFFNIKENRNGDIFLNIVESKKHGETDFERHQIVVFREDITEFLQSLDKAVDILKYPKKAERPVFPERAPAPKAFRNPRTGENSAGGADTAPAAE